jgi:hypothetical protein
LKQPANRQAQGTAGQQRQCKDHGDAQRDARHVAGSKQPERCAECNREHERGDERRCQTAEHGACEKMVAENGLRKGQREREAARDAKRGRDPAQPETSARNAGRRDAMLAFS